MMNQLISQWLKTKKYEKLARNAVLIYDKMGDNLISGNILTKYDDEDEDEQLGLKNQVYANLNDGHKSPDRTRKNGKKIRIITWMEKLNRIWWSIYKNKINTIKYSEMYIW